MVEGEDVTELRPGRQTIFRDIEFVDLCVITGCLQFFATVDIDRIWVVALLMMTP